MSADNWGKCPRCGKHDTLREDYELGFWSGHFEISYHAECLYEHGPGCGYEFSYKHSEPPPPPLSAGEQHGD